MPATDRNLVTLVLRHAVTRPDSLALSIATQWDEGRVTHSEDVSYRELAIRVADVQAGLRNAGLQAGDRVIVMLGVSIEMYAIALAVLASGMTAVLVDGGMSKRRIVQSITAANAKVIISTKALLRYRMLIPSMWRLKAMTPDQVVCRAEGLEVVPRGADDHALITFTSGSTGRPKGADRTHRLMIAQHLALADLLPPRSSDIDMPCFPVVALHNLACGVPTVMPAVDLRAPAQVEPAVVLDQINRCQITSLSGAPAFIDALVSWMASTGTTAKTVRRVAVGGAPVSKALCARVLAAFPGASATVVYGSTEAEPIAAVSMQDVVDAEGHGYLVGAPVASASVAIVALPRTPPLLDHRGITPYVVPDDGSGELVVAGEHVNRHYFDNPTADSENKVYALDGQVWHRTGDVAHTDAFGRIWLTGRTADLVHHGARVVHPLPIEARIDQIPGVARSALVAHERASSGEVAVQLDAACVASAVLEAVTEALRAVDLAGLGVRQVASIPVDGRHNSKIDRPALRARLRSA